MLELRARHQGNVLTGEIYNTLTNQVETFTRRGNDPKQLEWEARELLCYKYRELMRTKLLSWLRLRLKAYEAKERTEYLMPTTKLIAGMGAMGNRNFWQLCQFIYDNQDALLRIAPKPQSEDQYKYFQKVILPMLRTAVYMAGKSPDAAFTILKSG